MKKWIVVRRIALAILLFYLVIGGLHTNGERFKLFPIMKVKAAVELNTNEVLGRLQELRKTTYPDGSYFEKEGFEGGYECFGFARKIQYLAFGVIPRWSYSGVPSENLIQVVQLGRGQYSAANMQNFISQAKPGDIIQAAAGPGESQHTMIFCWINGNGTFTVWDANIISYNYISMREISYSRWAGKSWNVLTLLRSTNYPVIQRDSTPPTVSNVQVIENSSAGYTVSCEVTDSETGVARVQFPTWTAKDGQDDLIDNWNTNPAASGWRNGNTYTFHVRDMDHRYGRGIYYTDIYAFDVEGNVSDCKSVSANVQNTNEYASTTSYNDHQYYLYNDLLSWNDAKAQCEKNGGHLATITSQEEQDVISSLLEHSERGGYFLGAYDNSENNGPYSWITGEPFSYSNWSPGEPNNSYGAEHYLEIYTNGRQWNDNSDNGHGQMDVGFILEKELSVQGITLSKANLSLSGIGVKYQLSATIIPANAQNKSVSWNSSNSVVATVSGNGMVTAKSNGSTQITVTTANGKKTALCMVTVKIPPVRIKAAKIELNKKSLTIYKGKTYQLKASLTPKNSTDHIMWSSSNKTKAPISSNGKVTGKKAGDVKITATASSGKKVFCNIRIKEIKATSISINRKQLSLSAWKSYQLKVTLKPKNTTDTYSWSSSNKNIASVSKKGVVTAIKTGTVNITVKATNGKSVVCKVIVKPKTVAVKGITLNKAKISLKVGKTTTLSAIVSPGNATNKAIKWYSGNTSIVEVTGNGRIKAKRAGNTTITVQTGNNKKAICKVDVTKANSKINYKDVTVTSKLIDLANYEYYMAVTAKKANGSILWEYKTKKKPRTEIVVFKSIINKDKVYILEGDELNQFDRITGKKIWSLKKLKIFGGEYIFDSQDNLYICGWYGHALTAVDKMGKRLWTLKGIYSFYRAYKVRFVSGNLEVTFEGGGISGGGGKAYVTKQGRVINTTILQL